MTCTFCARHAYYFSAAGDPVCWDHWTRPDVRVFAPPRPRRTTDDLRRRLADLRGGER